MDNETKPRKGLTGRLIDKLNSVPDRQFIPFLIICIMVGMAIYAGVIIASMLCCK